jgi:hypothetical protein
MIKDYNQTCFGLEKEIVGKIKALESNKLLLGQFVYGSIAFVSLGGFIVSLFYLTNTLSVSGVYEYISLLLSDFTIVSYWKELSYSIVESLPFFEIALSLGILALFLWSILKNIKIQIFKNTLILTN